MPPKSALWQFFEKKDNNTAICLYCGKTLKTSGNTTNLRSHMESKHGSPRDCLTMRRPTKKLRSFRFSHISSTGNINSAEVDEKSFAIANNNSTICFKPLHDQFQGSGMFKNQQTSKGDNDMNTKITNNILYMICRDEESFSVVEREGFKDLIKNLAPGYSMPSVQILKNVLAERYDSISRVIKSRMKGIKNCTLTLNVQRRDNLQRFSDLTLHFLENHPIYQTSRCVLGTLELNNEQPGYCIAQNIKSLLDKWEVSEDQIMAVITDNSPDISAGIEIAFDRQKHIHCFANRLDSLGNMALGNSTEIKALLRLITEIISWLRNENVSNELSRFVRESPVKAKLNHWLSTLHIFRDFIELQSSIIEAMNHKGLRIPTTKEVFEITDIYFVLQPLECAVKEISNGEYMTSSLAIPLACCLRDKMNKINPGSEAGLKLKQTLLSECENMFQSIEKVEILAAATLLDPRFKTMYLRDDVALENAVNFIGVLVASHGGENLNGMITGKAQESIFSEHNKAIDVAWQNPRITIPPNTPLELLAYMRAPPEKVHENPELFWNQAGALYPSLAKISKTFLGFYVSSVVPDLMFLVAENNSNKHRKHAGDDVFSKMLFLKNIKREFWDF